MENDFHRAPAQKSGCCAERTPRRPGSMRQMHRQHGVGLSRTHSPMMALPSLASNATLRAVLMIGQKLKASVVEVLPKPWLPSGVE